MCKVATFKRKVPLRTRLELFLISSFVLFACGGGIQTNVLARSANEKPRWLQDASKLCSKNNRCAVAYHWHDDLGSATAGAKAKAVSVLVSEVAVTISGVLELADQISDSPHRLTEETSVSHRIAARVKGQLTEAKTAAHYWERVKRFTKDGPKLQYRSYVLVSVPMSVLNAMSAEALKAKKQLEADARVLSTRLGTAEGFAEDPIVLLRMIKGLKKRADDLTMRSVLTESLILQLEAQIAAKTEVRVLTTDITPQGHLKMLLGLSIDGVIPVGCEYEIVIGAASEKRRKNNRVKVSSAGTVSLTYSPLLLTKTNDVRILPQGLNRASKVLDLPSMASLGHLKRRVFYSGYSKRYIGQLVAANYPQLGLHHGEADPRNETDKPTFLLELNVRLSPKPTRITPSLIQVQGQIVAQLFYLNGGRVAIGPTRTKSVAGMGADERAAAKAVAQSISEVANSLNASFFGDLTPMASSP